MSTLVRVVCACGDVRQHHCHASWDTGGVLKPGTKWRSNLTAIVYWVLEVAADWVIYDDSPVASIDAMAMRRIDFLGRFTYLGPATAEDHRPTV